MSSSSGTQRATTRVPRSTVICPAPASSAHSPAHVSVPVLATLTESLRPWSASTPRSRRLSRSVARRSPGMNSAMSCEVTKAFPNRRSRIPTWSVYAPGLVGSGAVSCIVLPFTVSFARFGAAASSLRTGTSGDSAAASSGSSACDELRGQVGAREPPLLRRLQAPGGLDRVAGADELRLRGRLDLGERGGLRGRRRGRGDRAALAPHEAADRVHADPLALPVAARRAGPSATRGRACGRSARCRPRGCPSSFFFQNA